MITPETNSKLREILESSTSAVNPHLPGVLYCAVDSKGDEFFKHTSGLRGLGSDEPMTLDTIFWLASFTKVLTGISCMQLVEQGEIQLDNADDVERVAPELAAVEVLEKDEDGRLRLVPKQTRITLRMLLNHTGISSCALKG